MGPGPRTARMVQRWQIMAHDSAALRLDPQCGHAALGDSTWAAV